MNHRELQRQLDRISASRISKLNKGVPFHVALGHRNSITLRNKLKRMGLTGSHVNEALKMVDELGLQQTLENQPLSNRFATMKSSKPKPKVWNP
jgi:recombinational DNA repair protein RecR